MEECKFVYLVLYYSAEMEETYHEAAFASEEKAKNFIEDNYAYITYDDVEDIWKFTNRDDYVYILEMILNE